VARPHESGDGPLPSIGRYYEHAEEEVASQPCGGRYEASPAAWHWHPRVFCCHFDGIFLPWMVGAATSLLEDVENDQTITVSTIDTATEPRQPKRLEKKIIGRPTFRWDTSVGVRLPRYVEAGTGSTPRWPPGRQRSNRRRVSQLPRMLPCPVTASAAYCEQLG